MANTIIDRATALLGQDDIDDLLGYECYGVSRGRIQAPGPDFLERVWIDSDRPNPVLHQLQRLFDSGRLRGTGYLSILPVDQGVEHSASASFAPNPDYFDPEQIVLLALEAGCSAVASTLGVLGIVSRRYAHRIPFVVKLNHNQLLTIPHSYDQVPFADVEQAAALGAAAVGATIYFGSREADRQLQEVRVAFKEAHRLGMATVLWCYLQNPALRVEKGLDLRFSADLSSQANHLGATIEADIVKQKLPTSNGGLRRFTSEEWPEGATHKRVYDTLAPDHPIALTRYQVANSFMGRVGLLNSGGPSVGQDDLGAVLRTAIINKRAGGMGLISGRKAFQRPREEGVELLNAIQDVYLDPDISVA